MSDSNHSPKPVYLLSRVGDQAADAADFAYRHIVKRLAEARTSIEVHMYVWRADEVGYEIGQALWEAAERGVKVKILKDSGAVLFESQESNRKPFFRTRRTWRKRCLQRCMGWSFPDSYVEDHWDQSLGERLLKHPKVEFVWVAPTHTKYYCIDELYLITGSLNLEQRHRQYHDVMVEVRGRELIHDFRSAYSNCDSERLAKSPWVRGHVQEKHGSANEKGLGLSFLINQPERKLFEIKPAALLLISEATKSIHVEMAYLGDEDITDALVDAGHRGVKLQLLISEKSNVGNDVNYHVLENLMERTTIDVRLSPKMIHSKLMLVDSQSVLLGSANFSVFSMQRAGELDLLIEKDPVLVDSIRSVCRKRWELGRSVDSVLHRLPGHSKILAHLQQWQQRASKHQ